jgi:hypothetical protein
VYIAFLGRSKQYELVRSLQQANKAMRYAGSGQENPCFIDEQVKLVYKGYAIDMDTSTQCWHLLGSLTYWIIHVLYCGWHINDTALMITTPTITAIVTIATTSVMTSPGQEPNHQSTTSLYPLSLPSIIKLLTILFSILIVDYFVHRRRVCISTKEDQEQELAEAWQEPWSTKDWSTLYGLIALAHENNIQPRYIPFHTEHISTIQVRFKRPHRWALRRLLERGVIPLRINDGGVSTTQAVTWDISLTIPFIQLPHYQQTKSRAFFEFLIPHAEQAEVAHLISILGRNRMGYGISKRTHNSISPEPDCYTASSLRNRHKSGSGFPLSLGAWSICEVLLPFLPDTEILQAQGAWVDWLHSYFRSGPDTEDGQDDCSQSDLCTERVPLVPLLQYSSCAIVRLEAPHWGYVELDNFVLGAVEESGLEDRWVWSVCKSRAVEELKRYELEI